MLEILQFCWEIAHLPGDGDFQLHDRRVLHIKLKETGTF